jgi:hypothetical protein
MRDLLLVFLITLTGCVVTYGNFPEAKMESLPKDHMPKPFSYHLHTITSDPVEMALIMPSWYPLMMIDFAEKAINEVRHTLEISGMFSELRPADQNPPGHGTHCNIRLIVKPPSLSAFGAALSPSVPGGILVAPVLMMLGFVIPYYSGEGGLFVHYDLYRDGTHRETYRYVIKKKGMGGILFLPFAWLNFLTNDLKDAVRGTTLQFLLDAQGDGNL